MDSSKSDFVKVCVRARPTSNFAHGILSIDTSQNAISVTLAKDKTLHYINNQQSDWNYKFDHVLDNATQETVYDVCARDIVDNVLAGYNGTILAYGQTGAGKTFTMVGGTKDYKYRGIIPRSIAHIFAAIKSKPENEYTVRCSYVEVYNESYFDLLAGEGKVLDDLAVRDDDNGNVVVKDMAKPLAESEEAALNCLFEGETNRSIAEHEMNANSTRSHAIFTIYLETRSRVESSEKVVLSKLNLVDLAGSERVGKTGSSGTTLEEAKYINRSLSFLEQVVIALANKSRDHIPFRQSKLTNILRDSLGGNCKTRLIANIWSEKRHIEETISTLKFATRMMRVANRATINVQLDPMMLLAKYKREIRDLKQELAMHDTLANRSGVSYEALTPEESAAIASDINAYVRSERGDIEVVNLRQIREVFRQFKAMVIDLQSRVDDRTLRGPTDTGKQGKDRDRERDRDEKERDADRDRKERQREEEETLAMVGDLDELSGGFHVGAAVPVSPSPQKGKTTTTTTTTKESPKSAGKPADRKFLPDIKPSARATTTTTTQSTTTAKDSTRKASPEPESKENERDKGRDSKEREKERGARPSEKAAFDEYKASEGAEANDTYESNKKELKAKAAELASVSVKLNAVKKSIDEITERLAAKRSARPPAEAGGVEVIDEEEFGLVTAAKQAKGQYKDLFAQRQTIQTEHSYLKGLTENAKLTLCNKFLEWFHAKYGPAPADSESQSTPDDELDEAERFDKLEIARVHSEDPESVAFYNARKAVDSAAKKKTMRRGPAVKAAGQKKTIRL